MSYVDAIIDRDRDVIHVVERDKKGRRLYQEFPANWTFYYDDPRGKFRTIYGTSVSRFSSKRRSEFQKELRVQSGKRLWESDINPVFRCLADNYRDAQPPQLHTVFFDIETDFNPERGFALPEDPFNPVTAISLYQDWTGELFTLCLPPKTLTPEQSQSIADKFSNTLICENEAEMFEAFFQLIEDSDCLTGWNSSGYDIPYMVNRVTRVLSKDDTRRFCLWNQFPKPRTYIMFEKEQQTYDLIGRIHMDYLELYKKYNYEQRHSYKLDYIGEMEVGENKTQYEGTLDQLYNRDWFKFLEYNRQDTMLLYKIHAKLKFLDLANSIAHQNTVLLQTVMGSVAMIDQAIINEAHSQGLIVPDKRKVNIDEEPTAAGAYVATPKKGIHEWVAAVDINSLYPSTIRALNMAAETIIGQIRPDLTNKYIDSKIKSGSSFAGAWDSMFGTLEYEAVMKKDPATILTVDWEQGGSDLVSAAELWQIIFDGNNPWMLTANGTIFTYEREGIVPSLLTRWYSERKDLQKKLKQAQEASDKEQIEFYDKRQLVRKILLNSAYGALLNPHCRFYDIRIGQSTTLNGRQIVKHMSAYLNELITEEYDHTGDAIVYGDTDSCYFTANPMLIRDHELRRAWNKDVAVKVYDQLGEAVNASFPEFLQRAFHCPPNRGSIIKAGRELVADRGLFITKKRYAVNIYDKEGKRKDTNGKMGDIKAMGLDLKRADTPKYVQEFLMKVLTQVLAGSDRDSVISMITEFKQTLKEQASWTKGSPKGVNKLSWYHDQERKSKTGKFNMPGHVRAAINWNYLREMNGDNYSTKIMDGMKIVVCKLKNNALNMTSIAYPTDELRLPEWFKSLHFDDSEMERILVDEKIENLLGVLKWNLREATDVRSTFNQLFQFY